MSVIQVTAGDVPNAKPHIRPATLIIGFVSITLLLLIALHVINAGYIRRDIQALQNGEAWQIGGWLSQIVLRVVSLLDDTQVQQTALSLVAAVVSGLLVATLYDRLRASGWYVAGALVVLIAVSLHAGSLYLLTANSRAIPLLIAFAVLIPAIRSMEDTGDVQSAIGMGLLMPLLLLASPITTPLIVPFAIGAALANPDARRDGRAFVAMLLVTILPTLIVAIGILGFVAQARLDVAEALLPYVRAYSDIHWGDPTDSLLALVAFAPMMIVPIAYCFWPNLPERRHVYSALAVVILPLYLVVAREMLVTTATTIVPPLTLLAAFVSWLAVVRLPFQLRVVALAMLVLGAVASWTLPQLWTDAEWKAALLTAPFQPPLLGMELRPGL
jgi:hypothetical protein